MRITLRELLGWVCFVLMFLFICYVICYAGAIFLKDFLKDYTPPQDKVCEQGHYERSPHHIICLHGNKNILCNQESEWETYFVCDKLSLHLPL